jgi:hypothetical protein
MDQARAEATVAYVWPELLDPRVDLKHRSYLSAILREDLGHVHSRTTRTLLPIHDLWVPKYVNHAMLVYLPSLILMFVLIN